MSDEIIYYDNSVLTKTDIKSATQCVSKSKQFYKIGLTLFKGIQDVIDYMIVVYCQFCIT